MELFYNPERMTEREIKETFIAHQWLVDEIISILKRQPDGPGVQHVVIVAPRGMGKTTMLLMLRFTVLGTDTGEQWQPVLFPEESYDVYELADLWLAVLNHIAAETKNSELQEEISTVTKDPSHLEENALARIKNWRVQNGKRLMLLIDNFDMILDQIGDERENARLRDVLMNDGTLMLVGGATTFFKEARAYDQPLYNLFKIYNLNSLDPNQIRDLLRRRAELDELKDFDETLRVNESRIRVLEYFTGGNPRLVLMLYRIITHSDISEVRRGLEKLLDEVTPYYKAKIETLPPQQRKILDQIARSTSRTREGMTPTEIASETRLPVNQVSSQLKRLSEAGYVHTANIRSRSSYYTLSEPLYAIWHQMRFGRDARKRMNWLIAFLKNWYDAKELGTECERLLQIFRNYMSAGEESEARNALEQRRYLMEAIDDSNTRASTLESVVLNYLELSDVDTLRSDVLNDVDINSLSSQTRGLLVQAGLVTDEHARLRVETQSDSQSLESEVAALLGLARASIKFARYDDAKQHFKSVLRIAPSHREAIMSLAAVLLATGNREESLTLLSGIEKGLTPGSASALILQSTLAYLNKQSDESLRLLDKVLEYKPNSNEAWFMKAMALFELARLDEAIEALSHVTSTNRQFESWYLLAKILSKLNRKEEALEAIDHALSITPDYVEALRMRSMILIELGRSDAALVSIDRILSIVPDSSTDWLARGDLLLAVGSGNEALESFDRAIELDPKSIRLQVKKALALDQLGQTEEGMRCIDKILVLNPASADAYLLRAIISTNPEEATAAFIHACDLQNTTDDFISHLPIVNALKITLFADDNDLEKVRSAWDDLTHSEDRYSQRDDWLSHASDALRSVAVAGHLSLAKELITTSDLNEELFPLARALDYLLTNDESLVEKLSPEIRQIVTEIVTELRPDPQKKTRKEKNAMSNRKSKKQSKRR